MSKSLHSIFFFYRYGPLQNCHLFTLQAGRVSTHLKEDHRDKSRACCKAPKLEYLAKLTQYSIWA